eukprot:149186-Pyramimonas_sp.AAC.1
MVPVIKIPVDSPVLVVDAGATMFKVTAALRPCMPAWCLLLQKLSEARVVRGAVDDVTPCTLCQARARHLLAPTGGIDQKCRCIVCASI